jgi:hypothetical protein
VVLLEFVADAQNGMRVLLKVLGLRFSPDVCHRGLGADHLFWLLPLIAVGIRWLFIFFLLLLFILFIFHMILSFLPPSYPFFFSLLSLLSLFSLLQSLFYEFIYNLNQSHNGLLISCDNIVAFDLSQILLRQGSLLSK